MITLSQGKDNNVVFSKMSEATRLTEFGLRQAWFAIGDDLYKTANREVLKRPRHGRLYIRRTASGRRRKHRASLPGESHANMTGTLRKSMQWKVRGRELFFGYGVANENVPEYGKFVERGTSKMKARPTLQNSIDANIRNAEQHLEKHILKEFQ